MKKIIIPGAIILIMVMSSFVAIGNNLTSESDNLVSSSDLKEYAKGRLIIGFKEEIDISNIDNLDGFNIIKKIDDLNIAVIEVEEGSELESISSLSSNPCVKYVEPDYVISATYIPSDPKWGQQWGPKKINCEGAWDAEKGSSDVVLAIVDSGVDYNHEEFRFNMWKNKEGDCGYDFVNEDRDPMDDYGHGTHCAGIAGAKMDNGKGIAGVAQVSIMAVKVLGYNGQGYITDAVEGIKYAADNGADVISMSFGGSHSPSEEGACDYAWNKGCILFGAAGNDYGGDIVYPGAYDSVVAVGSTNRYDKKSSFSNVGEELELMAPGDGIYSTMPNHGYDEKSGTSMATPHAAGVAALIKSRRPSTTNSEIRYLLKNTAVDLGDKGKDDEYGFGRINARSAVGGPTLGNLNIMCNGNKQESYAKAVCNNPANVPCNPGEKISFSIEYQVDCWTMTDYGEIYCRITYKGHDYTFSKNTDNHGQNFKGVWTKILECEPGETIQWYIRSYLKDGILWDTWEKEQECEGSLLLIDYGNLNCEGNIIKEGVKPGSTIKDTFTVKNEGMTGSKLDWEIVSDPYWGDWTFEPSSGSNLGVGKSTTVDVTIVVPDYLDGPLTGFVRVENFRNDDDYEQIQVKITKPRTRQFSNSFFSLLLQRISILKLYFNL